MLAREVLMVICRSTGKSVPWVWMNRYFKSRGWNERDRRNIVSDLVSAGLVEQHFVFSSAYRPTPKGRDEFGRKVMAEPFEHVRISAEGGSVVGGIVINSDGATAHVGSINNAAQLDFYKKIERALRADAEEANDLESSVAQGYADDLAQAVDSQDQSRIDAILGRVNGLLGAATSAFSLTRGIVGG